MIRTKKYLPWVVLVMLMVGAGGCAANINENVQNLSKLDQPDPLDEPVPLDEPEEVASDDPSYSCKTQMYEARPGFNTLITLNPQPGVIWPGSIIDAATIPTGAYTPITLKRGPLTFSTSLKMAGQVSKTIDEASLSSFREARNEVLAQELTVDAPAEYTSSVIKVHSKEHLQIALGVSAKTGLHDFEGRFNFDNESIKQRYLVKFVQKYYTIDVDPPAQPGDFFTSNVSWNDLKSQISDGAVSPMYVSTITYGRMALFCVTTEDEDTEIGAALDYAYGGTIKVDAKFKFAKQLRKISMHSYVVGGSPDDALAAAVGGVEDINDYIRKGSYSKESPGLPLSYTLRYLSDNSIGNIVMSTTYPVRTCVQLPPQPILEIREDFTRDDGGWSASGGEIKWLSHDDKRLDLCKTCEDPRIPARGGFIHWIDQSPDLYSYYKAPKSFTERLSGDYVGGTLEYWLLSDRTVGSADWRHSTKDRPDIILEARDGTILYFVTRVSREQRWEHLSINLQKRNVYPNCWFEKGENRCVEDTEIGQVLDNLDRLEIRAEYWEGGDTGFLDDVTIVPPKRQDSD